MAVEEGVDDGVDDAGGVPDQLQEVADGPEVSVGPAVCVGAPHELQVERGGEEGQPQQGEGQHETDHHGGHSTPPGQSQGLNRPGLGVVVAVVVVVAAEPPRPGALARRHRPTVDRPPRLSASAGTSTPQPPNDGPVRVPHHAHGQHVDAGVDAEGVHPPLSVGEHLRAHPGQTGDLERGGIALDAHVQLGHDELRDDSQQGGDPHRQQANQRPLSPLDAPAHSLQAYHQVPAMA